MAGPVFWAAVTPERTKIPAPTTELTPIMVSVKGPRALFSVGSPSEFPPILPVPSTAVGSLTKDNCFPRSTRGRSVAHFLKRRQGHLTPSRERACDADQR